MAKQKQKKPASLLPKRTYGYRLNRDETWTCPYAMPSCKSYGDHWNHPPRTEMLSDLSLNISYLEKVLSAPAHSYDESITDEGLDGFFARPDFESAKLSEVFARYLVGAKSTYLPHPKKPAPLNPFERLVQMPLGLPTLKILASGPSKFITAEGVIGFIIQPKVHSALVVRLLEANFKTEKFPEVKEAFKAGDSTVRVALALLNFKTNWKPGELHPSANRVLNRFNGSRENALETLEVMSTNWSGSLDDFVLMVDALK